MRQSLHTYNVNQTSQDLAHIGQILNEVMLNSSFLDISVADTNGTILVSTRTSFQNTSISHLRAYQEDYGTTSVRFVGVEDGLLYIHILSPLNYEEQMIGLMYVRSLAPELYDLNNNYEGLRDTGEILLGSRINETTGYFFTPLRFALGSSFPFSLSDPDLPINVALNGQEIIFEGVDYRYQLLKKILSNSTITLSVSA